MNNMEVGVVTKIITTMRHTSVVKANPGYLQGHLVTRAHFFCYIRQRQVGRKN